MLGFEQTDNRQRASRDSC